MNLGFSLSVYVGKMTQTGNALTQLKNSQFDPVAIDCDGRLMRLGVAFLSCSKGNYFNQTCLRAYC